MPPKGSKRGAPSPAGGRGKRSNADPIAPKVKEIERAVKQAQSLSDSCKDLLVGMVSNSLQEYAADRHAFQNSAIDMIKETLDSVRANLEQAVAEAKAKVDNSDSEKSKRASALEEAQAAVADLTSKHGSALSKVDEIKSQIDTAKSKLQAAEQSASEKEASIKQMSEQKSRLESVMKDQYEVAKANAAGKRVINALEKIFGEIGLEQGLIDSVEESLRKPPIERGTFDRILAEHIEKNTSSFIEGHDKALSEAESAKTQLQEDKAAAKGALEAATQDLSEANRALAEARMALNGGQDSLKTAQKAVTAFDKDMGSFGTDWDSAKTALSSFEEGPLKSFAALKDLAPPPVPEPTPEPEEASAAAAADAEAVAETS